MVDYHRRPITPADTLEENVVKTNEVRDPIDIAVNMYKRHPSIQVLKQRVTVSEKFSFKQVSMEEISSIWRYLVYLSNRNVLFSGYHFHLFFQERGIKRKQFFWSKLSKDMSKGEILIDWVFI